MVLEFQTGVRRATFGNGTELIDVKSYMVNRLGEIGYIERVCWVTLEVVRAAGVNPQLVGHDGSTLGKWACEKFMLRQYMFRVGRVGAAVAGLPHMTFLKMEMDQLVRRRLITEWIGLVGVLKMER